MKKVRLFEQFINEGAFVVWYEDKKGKHLLGTFHNKKAAEKYKSEVEVDMLDHAGEPGYGDPKVDTVGMMSKNMWDKKEAPYIKESINEYDDPSKINMKKYIEYYEPSQVKDLQEVIGQTFSDNFSSTLRSELVDVKKKGSKWVAITKEAPSQYGPDKGKPSKNKKLKEAPISITWNAFFY